MFGGKIMNVRECINKSKDYIQENLTENLTLEDLARVANMSKTYYTTIFKKETGVSLWDYIVSKRIEMAKKIIKNDNSTMLEIATKCGFNNTANFNRAFKKHTGKTPSQYRKDEEC